MIHVLFFLDADAFDEVPMFDNENAPGFPQGRSSC